MLIIYNIESQNKTCWTRRKIPKEGDPIKGENKRKPPRRTSPRRPKRANLRVLQKDKKRTKAPSNSKPCSKMNSRVKFRSKLYRRATKRNLFRGPKTPKSMWALHKNSECLKHSMKETHSLRSYSFVFSFIGFLVFGIMSPPRVPFVLLPFDICTRKENSELSFSHKVISHDKIKTEWWFDEQEYHHFPARHAIYYWKIQLKGTRLENEHKKLCEFLWWQ